MQSRETFTYPLNYDRQCEMLASYIRRHDTQADVRIGADGVSELWALDKWTERDGTLGEVWVRLSVSVSAVREWLGY